MDSAIESCKWIRITRKNQIFMDEIPEQVKSPNTKYWIKAKFKSTYKTKWGNIYPMYHYEILDDNLNPSSIEDKQLSIVSFSDEVVHSFQHTINCVFKAHDGGIFKERFTNTYGGGASFNIIYNNAIDFLNKYRNSMTVKEVELMQSNELLAGKNLELQEKIESLTTDLSDLIKKNEKLEELVEKLKSEVNQLNSRSTDKSGL